jgi:gliding motility-associated-like protein
VTYSTPTGSDNCLFVVVQTDNSGLTSGSVFPQGITTQTYAAIDSSGNTTTCTFTVEVFEIPDPAVISTDTIALCNTFSSAISATAVTSGTGAWSILQGGGTIANTSADATTVNNLTIGTNKLMWSVSSPSCGTKRDTLVIVVWPLPSTAHVQDTLVACTEVGLLLQATAPQFGTGTWTSNSGIVFANVHAPITAISNTNGGNHTIVWTVSSGICPSSSDTLFMELPNVAHIGQNDTTLCEQNFPLLLTGSAPSNGQQPIWSVLSGEAAFSNNYSSQTNLTATSIGVVEIIYWLTHPVCGSTTDMLILYVNDCNGLLTDIPTLFTPNHDHKNDVFDIPDLGLNYPGCRVEIYNRWGGVVFESDGYLDPWDGTFKGEDTPMGTYFYHIRLNDADDTRFNGSISIIR